MRTIRYVVIFFFAIQLTNCKGQNKEIDLFPKNHKYQMNKEKTKYYIDYNLFLSYEIYINDVKIANNIQSGPVSGMRRLNKYMLGSGKQTIRLVDKDIYPDTNIPDDLFKSMKMKVYTSDENEENIQELAVFPFPDTVVPRPYYFEQTWEFESEIPFELEGWQNGHDLRLIDEKELEEMVVAKYEELRQMLNKGNVDGFMSANEKGYKEFIVADIMNKAKWDFYEGNIRELLEDQKGQMRPLENYKTVIQGNGKLVSLERVDLPYLGESALFAIDGEETYYTDYIYLYMPQGKNTLEPIRYQIDYGLVGH